MTQTLQTAVEAGIISQDQAEKLTAFLNDNKPVAEIKDTSPRFDLANVLWYLGALIVIGAMGLFSTLAFSLMGPIALLMTAVVYAVVFVLAGHYLWYERSLSTPGGLLIAAAVCMAPLAIFSLQDILGWWAGQIKPGNYRDFYVWIKGGFIPMEVGTIVASLVALRFYRFPFILMIAAVALWFMSMDVADWLKGIEAYASFSLRQNVSMVFGLILIPLAWAVDLARKDKDYGFWLHMVGIMTFWGGLSMQSSDSELSKFIYCLINLALIGFAVFLSRRVYAVFGGLGLMMYLGHLAYKVFKDSLMFPFALSFLGLAVIGAGLFYYRRAGTINGWLESRLPTTLLRLRPAVRD
ncbi:MAG: hypothetical protein ACRCWF_04105 [Beijerinckiaceae bacterium]